MKKKNVVEVDLDEFEKAYEKYAAECEAAMRLALDKIQNLSEAIDRSGNRNPFDRIESRIKTFKSVKGKCENRECGYTYEAIRETIKDVAGIRIITKYTDEIDLVKDMIKKIPGISVEKEKDYVREPKPNGYQSLHLDCRIEIYDPYNGSQFVPVEIQIRDKAMNLWATLEHDLKYKNENPSPEVEEMFRDASKILHDFAMKAIHLRDYGETTEN